MKILNEIKTKAKNKQAVIVLPEANMDERVKNAAMQILKEGLSKIIVFGKESEYSKDFKSENCQIIDIETFEKQNEFATQLYEMRKA